MFPAYKIADAVSEFKHNWTKSLNKDSLDELCVEVGCKWRDRLLTPTKTIQLLLLQVLHGNTACSHLPHLSQMNFSAMAYCKARIRLPLKVLELLLERLAENIQSKEFNDSLWYGHRVWMGDGTSCSMPDTEELQQYFEQPSGQGKGCGFPVSSLLALVHVNSGMIQKILVSPYRTHDMKRVSELHPELRRNDVILKDRGFCSFAHLSLLLQRNVHGVFRMHQRQKVDFRAGRAFSKPNQYRKGKPSSRWLKKLGKKDQLVQWHRTNPAPSWMTQEQRALLPQTIVVRELRYRIIKPGFRSKEITLVTTLVDVEKYPKEALAKLYATRWEIETNFRHLKITMGMDILKCRTKDGVLKEIYAFVLVYNLVRLVMLEAAKRQAVPPNSISFIDALRWLRIAPHGRELPVLITNPHRPGRVEPRVIKRRPKQYKLMNKPRAELRKIMKIQSLAA